MKFFYTLILIFNAGIISGQADNTPFIRLTNPYKTINAVKSSRQFIIGSTCKNCALTINGKRIKVYPTGAFVHELILTPGDSLFTMLAEAGTKSLTKKINYTYTLPIPAEPLHTLEIESIKTLPAGDLVLMPGDKIQFRVKALTNCVVKAMQNTILYELPVSQTSGMPGIYQGEYMIRESDSFMVKKIPVTVTDSTGTTITRETSNRFSILSSLASEIAITKGRLAHLEYGLGDDRLGGAKIGYLDSNIVLKIAGKVGSHYKVQLAKTRTAYIPDELVELMPKGTFTPESLTSNWTVYGDDKYDYVKCGLFARLPYQSFQLVDPSRIVVDIFGATNNTNWITQLETAKEIKHVYYEQKEDDVFRIIIELKHAQHWGHQLYYAGNSLVIKIKHQPENLSLKNLTIAVDAGHGGTNTGAVGPTGVLEKELTLAVSLKLQKALEKEGASVIMTRTKEQFFDNKERILFYRDSLPDLLLSIHLNSSEDPIRVGGTGTFYRYVGFKNLSLNIYRRILELGLREYGNTGSFNFMLNSPTEYPNALVETLFLSNPEEEMKILDPEFQQQMVEKIVSGIKDFLEGCKTE
ncbi:MAG: N-acetylmuramoyl-L-alanine amidase [Ferruginibacter sp.]|nr:N-acetylmuramoyl-L-alanine amidase [Ferruginibacter sp.]